MPFPGAKTNLYDPSVHLPLIIASPKQSKRGVANDSFASWVDVTPTILDWAGVKAGVKAGPTLPGRSLLVELEREHAPDGPDAVFGSHVQHEVTMYYPMRSIRTRNYKYILNLASALEVPTAQDLFDSVTWQGMLKRHDTTLGPREMSGFLHRPKEELYDLQNDPNELKNLAPDPASAPVLGDLRARLKAWQEKTRDPWLVKYEHE
jgi:N-sulfoglucosamine sulfohydrolase